jgi:hypothetical protein
MTGVPEWRPGDRVAIAGAPGDLARLHGVRATVVEVGGGVAMIRFDSPKLLGGRLRAEIEVATAWLVEAPAPGLAGAS